MGTGLFQAFRENGRPTYYEENKWPVTADTVIYGLIFCFLAILFSFYVVLIGVRGIERLYAFVRVTVSLFIGAVILICNYGYGWEYGSVSTVMEYKAFSEETMKAELGLKIGLRGINVTFVGFPREDYKMVNYNERFSWQWAQGKSGFGPSAGRISREYRAAQIKGLPYPKLWTVEYFTIDEGNFRHGRYYRLAGWYCHIALWTAFPLWLLSNILFFMVIRYGAYYLALTGSVLLLTNVLFSSIRNKVPLVLHFNSIPLKLHYNWCYYLVLFTGLLCVCLALLILFMDLRHPEKITTFFGVDLLQDYVDFYADPAELGHVPVEVRVEASSGVECHSPAKERSSQEILTLRKRTLSKRFQRSSWKHPVPAPRRLPYQTTAITKGEFSSDFPVYENIDLTRFDPIGEEEEETKDGSQDEIITTEIKSIDV